MSALTEQIRRLQDDATTLAGGIDLLLRQHDQLSDFPPDQDIETLLSLKLFRSLDPQCITAISKALQDWKSVLFGRIVAIRDGMCPTKWMVGICESVDMRTSEGSWLMLKPRNDELIIIDTSNKDHTIARTPIAEYPCRFGFIVYLNEGCMRPAMSDGIGNTHYRMLAKQNRLFCIAANLLNAAEQVQSDQMTEALLQALAAKDALRDLRVSLRITQKVQQLYSQRSTTLDPNGSMAALAQRNIGIMEANIKQIETEFPEIPLLGPDKTDNDPDSDVLLDPDPYIDMIGLDPKADLATFG